MGLRSVALNHEDGDTLNNQRYNLRYAEYPPIKEYIGINRHIGCFDNEIDAARAKILFGSFARLNFPC